MSEPIDFERRGQSKRYDPEWLAERVKLFEQVCAPTINKQTNKDFEWLVLFGEWTPPELWLGLQDKYKFTPVMASSWKLYQLLDEAVRVGTPYVITTNVDSDDGISVDFIDQVQRQFREKDMAIYVDNGVRWDLSNGTYVSAKSVRNPFHTIVEKVGNGAVRTVLAHSHGQLDGLYDPIIHIDNKTTRWLMGIHGNNLVNKMNLVSEDKLKPFWEVSKLFGL